VLRYSPQGAVDLAPFLSVTFDQPMVPLTSIGDLAARDVPVRLTPQPEGIWRWVGTKTLMFEPTLRFPGATDYVVEVPAGTRSATGGTLAETVTWSFSTPPLQIVAKFPEAVPVVREPLILVGVDQAIDPQAVLATITLEAGGKTYPLALAGEEDVQANEELAQHVASLVAGRWLAFYPTEQLPYDSTVTVMVGPGTPSAEGPRTTVESQSFSFTTYGPLRVVTTRCGWGNHCPPLSPWYIEFNNPLDQQAFEDAQVRIEPELAGAVYSIYDNMLRIGGRSQGRTTYKVTLGADLRDEFGQTLGADTTVTFEVGSSEPALYTPNQNFVVLDPASKPSYSIYTMNYASVQVRIYQVAPADWPKFLTYLGDVWQKPSLTPPGKEVYKKRTSIDKKPDQLVETVIDLSGLLKDGQGNLILVIEPDESLIDTLRPDDWKPVIRTWVAATDLALDVLVDSQEMLAWANALSDGAPLGGVDLTLYPGAVTAKTGADGTARIKLATTSDDLVSYLVARHNGHETLLPRNTWGWQSGGWSAADPSNEYRWYVFDDRQMYRPGEEARVKGWVREARVQRGSDPLELPPAGAVLSWELVDARGNRVQSGDMTPNPLGGFDLTLELPETMNLGQAVLRFNYWGQEYYHTLQVQEFRRPEFEVTTSANPGPWFVGDVATVQTNANYYAGGPLPDAEVTWTVTSTPGNYTPPNWDEFTFGIWSPWWWGSGRYRGSVELPDAESKVQTLYGRTDASGEHYLDVALDALDPPQATNLTAEASVMDVNRQAWAASTQLLVHPANLYVGLRSGRTFVEKGQPIVVEAIVVDLEGGVVVEHAIKVRAVRLEWKWVKGEWQEVEADAQICNTTSAGEPVTCRFDTPEGGTYRIVASVVDDQGRTNVTQITRWVSGSERPNADKVEQESVELIPDKQIYNPGDTAEILVQAPFRPAEGLMTVQRDGLISSERFTMSEGTYTLRVLISEDYIPNVHVQVDLVGEAARLNSQGEADTSLPTRPAYATGRLSLPVSTLNRTLSIAAVPRENELEPGGETTLDITVTDSSGAPVADAELAVVVVDEAVLALSGYQLADPLAAFYPERYNGVSGHYLRSWVLLTDPEQLRERGGMAVGQTRDMLEMDAAQGTALPGEAMLMEMVVEREAEKTADDDAQPIRVRTDFNALAQFVPAVPTDGDGTATVEVKLPDSLTRYRVMVVAVSGSTHYGKGESSITARLPLMVRPSAPRFLNYGDTFELPVVLQNQTGEDLVVDVVAQVSNLALTEGAGRRVTVPARNRVEVRFATSTQSAGTARGRVGAVSGSYADAAQFELPVYTPATTEACAVYGTVDEGAIAQPIIAPTDVYTQFGGLEISTSSTALQALTDAVLYLTNYKFECSEQLASRVLAVAALRDVLTAFQARELPSPAEIEAAMVRDLERLGGMQNDDGGWPVWVKGRESWPFQSIHVTHALVRAQQKGYEVPAETINAALGYLRSIESHYPSWYSEDVRNTLTSYALYVRFQLGDNDVARAKALVNEVGIEKLSLESLGWLLQVLAPSASSEVTDIVRYLNNRVVETAGAANFTTSYREEDSYLLLASNRRADGIILDALMTLDPQNDLVVKLVRGLLAHRKAGRWGNTQENVFILLALDKYFATYEAQTPEFVARVWLGDQYVAEFNHSGRTTEYQTTDVPMSYLAQSAEEQSLILSKEGPGRLYYRLGMTYAPTNLKLDPMDQGFVVTRRYEAVDDPADVWQDADGVWHIAAGARVRVRLTMVADNRRYHVALVDPLPAGLEAMNPALAVTGNVPADPNNDDMQPYWWWRWTWYEHQNLRDERAEAFSPLLWDGVHTYTYVARATTPGTFVVPPARAEEMYSPETFGRSATDRLVVE
jgi:hypothetical protein